MRNLDDASASSSTDSGRSATEFELELAALRDEIRTLRELLIGEDSRVSRVRPPSPEAVAQAHFLSDAAACVRDVLAHLAAPVGARNGRSSSGSQEHAHDGTRRARRTSLLVVCMVPVVFFFSFYVFRESVVGRGADFDPLMVDDADNLRAENKLLRSMLIMGSKFWEQMGQNAQVERKLDRILGYEAGNAKATAVLAGVLADVKGKVTEIQNVIAKIPTSADLAVHVDTLKTHTTVDEKGKSCTENENQDLTNSIHVMNRRMADIQVAFRAIEDGVNDHQSTASNLAANINIMKRKVTAVSDVLGISVNETKEATFQHKPFGSTLPPGVLGRMSRALGLAFASAVSAGTHHNVAVLADGTVKAWGTPLDSATNVPDGLSGVEAVSAGWLFSIALIKDGTLHAWGSNYYGQTDVPDGLGRVRAVSTGNRHSLAVLSNGTVTAWGGNEYSQASVPDGLENVTSIAAGSYHSLAVLGSGAVSGWGCNDHGQAKVPGGLDDVVAVAAGRSHSLALKRDGGVVAWGHADYTVLPSGLGRVRAIAAGSHHSLALLENGTVAAWGSNSNGQIIVPGGLENVKAISGGWGHSIALKEDGSVLGWGYNGYGEASVPNELN